MADPTFTCPECRRTSDYYGTPKTLDPRMLPKCRTICQDCADRIEPQAASFTVETNFRKAGPSAQAAKAAAESAKLNDTHRKIYRLLKGEPLTADEVADRLGMVLNTARARITDLHKAGWIFDTGERGETDARKPATIWAVSQRRVAA
jgi:predicted Rossmann fold nucleotide-binding protein DprA/Smf involved in DNA uptake